jgi:hypothetical protein
LPTAGLHAILLEAQSALNPSSLNPSALRHINPESPFFERMRCLATHSNHALYPAGYQGNCGVGVRMRPPRQAPLPALAAHFLKLHAKGRVVIFPRDVFSAYCQSHSRMWNLLVCSLAAKDAEILRLVADPFMLNDPDLKTMYAAMWGALSPPQLADICELIMNARAAFPDQELVAGRADVASAYNRIISSLHDMCHQCFLFHMDGRDHVAIPIIRTFGLQASNYEFGVLTEFFKERSRARLLAFSPLPLSTFATDDAIMVGPPAMVRAEMSAVAADFVQFAGEGAHAVEKDLFGPAIPITGFHFDLRRSPGLASLTEKAMARLLTLFWHVVPLHVCEGDLVSNVLFQRLGSYAIRYSNCVVVLLPFSRGFSASLDRPHVEANTRWTRRAVYDLWMWRVVLCCSLYNSTWLRVPVTYPLLIRRVAKTETDPERAARQAAAADYIIHGDARLTGNRGAGMVVADRSGTQLCWMQMLLREFTHYMSATGCMDEMNINVLEFAQAVVSVIAFIAWARSVGLPLAGCHIHVWTDNSSAFSYIRRNRATHPFHLLLLQIMSLLMVQHGILLTVGHIPGIHNVVADAISREFAVPNGSNIRASLAPVPRLYLADRALTFLRVVARLPFQAPLPTVQLSLTLLATVNGAVSV